TAACGHDDHRRPRELGRREQHVDLDLRRGRGPRVAGGDPARPEAPRMRRALVTALVLAAIVAPGAEAHFGTAKLGYRSTITGVDPKMPGLRFKILSGD